MADPTTWLHFGAARRLVEADDALRRAQVEAEQERQRERIAEMIEDCTPPPVTAV